MTDIGRGKLSGNAVVDTVISAANGTYQASDNSINIWGNGSDVTTMQYYVAGASDATRNGGSLEASILKDYDTSNTEYQTYTNSRGTFYTLDSAGNKILDPREPLNLQDFSWTDELKATLNSISNVTERLDFEKQSSADSDTDLTVSMGGYDARGSLPTTALPDPQQFFDPGGEGEGVFPGTLPKGAGFTAHLAVNGDASFANTASENGGSGYKSWVITHELGHDFGLSHSFGTASQRDSSRGAFGADMALNNEKYTVMSYTDSTGSSASNTSYGHSVGYMAIDVAALQQLYGIGSNNTGNTTYNLVDGAQITGAKSNNAALDIDGSDESKAEIAKAYSDAAKAGGVLAGFKAGAAKIAEQIKNGTANSGEETIGRAYRTIYDGQKETDASGKDAIGNGGIDEISYSGSEQSVMINLNDAGLGNDKANTQWTELRDEIKVSSRFGQLSTEFQNEIDGTVNSPQNPAGNPTLRTDAFNAGGFFSKTYETDAKGNVSKTQDGGYSIAHGVVIENATGGDKADTIIGNEHDNVLDGGKGNDALYGGAGNDTLRGGIGDDVLYAGRGENILQGGAGADEANYAGATLLKIPTATAGNFQGLNITIDGTVTTVAKPSPMMFAQPRTDALTGIEKITGTDNADVFTAENISGNMYIDGGKGINTLDVSNLGSGYTLTLGKGVIPAGQDFAGQAYDGRVSDGKNTLYFTQIDTGSIKAPPVPTPVAPEVSAPLPAQSAPLPAQSAPLPDKSTSLTIPEAARALQADIPIVETTLLAKQAAGTLSAQESAVLDVVHSPAPGALLETLQAGGVEDIDVAGKDMDTPYARVHATLSAGYESLNQHELPAPDLEPYYAQQAAAQHAQHQDQAAELDTVGY